jgi:arylsulfatase A-like enzyme
MGVYDSSLIIITSDHGELFGEHGYVGHRVPLYDEVIRVPLIVKFPFNEKISKVKNFITLSDLYPTILSICDLPIPEGISGKAFGDSSPVVSELYNYDIGKHRAIYDGQYKYMKFEKQKGPELYDLENDPMRKINLAEKMPVVAAEMEKKLKEWGKKHQPKYKVQDKKDMVDHKKVRDDLKALGYIK